MFTTKYGFVLTIVLTILFVTSPGIATKISRYSRVALESSTSTSFVSTSSHQRTNLRKFICERMAATTGDRFIPTKLQKIRLMTKGLMRILTSWSELEVWWTQIRAGRRVFRLELLEQTT